MFPVLSRMAIDLINIQASSVASESVFSTSGSVSSIQRTRHTPASLEMRMCLKDHLDAKERKQDKCPLEIPLDFEEDVFDDDVQRNEAIPLSDEEITLDASNKGTMSSGEPREEITYNTCHSTCLTYSANTVLRACAVPRYRPENLSLCKHNGLSNSLQPVVDMAIIPAQAPTSRRKRGAMNHYEPDVYVTAIGGYDRTSYLGNESIDSDVYVTAIGGST
nr:zinc finger BED domain-containing protein RICESLEEPER 2 [Tanacetum cinerariifolium]